MTKLILALVILNVAAAAFGLLGGYTLAPIAELATAAALAFSR